MGVGEEIAQLLAPPWGWAPECIAAIHSLTPLTGFTVFPVLLPPSHITFQINDRDLVSGSAFRLKEPKLNESSGLTYYGFMFLSHILKNKLWNWPADETSSIYPLGRAQDLHPKDIKTRGLQRAFSSVGPKTSWGRLGMKFHGSENGDLRTDILIAWENSFIYQ